MRTLHPPIEPYRSRHLAVGRHRVYVEECGNPVGIPVLFLHGGPGSGCRSYQRRFFDPSRFRIVLVDQRGAGRSQPQGELRDNHTDALLADLERIRRALAIERWMLFGGSWGATLALLYAQAHPECVTGLVLRGTFLARRRDLLWFVETGAPRIYPEQWSSVLASLPQPSRENPIAAMDAILNGADELAQRRVAREWTQWGNRVALAEAFDAEGIGEHVPLAALHQARIELNYAKNGYFIEDGQILKNADERLSHVPILLVHGRRDLVCPVDASFELQRRLPHAEIEVLANAGHLAQGDEMIDALIRATDRMAGWV